MVSPLTRAIIISATIAALFAVWKDQPKPIISPVVPYCVVTERAAAKDELGQWHYGWSRGYGPCYLQDEYKEI